MRAAAAEDPAKQQMPRKWTREFPRPLNSAFSAREKVRLAAAMKMATSASNGWLAGRLSMAQPATVSPYVRRFRLAGRTKKPKFQAALLTIKP